MSPVLDCFETLGLPRRVWLDAGQVNERFLAVSAATHPDKASPERRAQAEAAFAQANRSQHVLQNSRLRLLHWLELAGVPSAPHVQPVPEAVLGRFPPVAQLLKEADELLARKRGATSPMIQVQLFQAGMTLTEKLQQLQTALSDDIRALEAELKSCGDIAPDAFPRLEDIAAQLGFLERWHSQLTERISQLVF